MRALFFSDSAAVQMSVSGKRLRETDPKTGDLMMTSPFANELDNGNETPPRSTDDPVVVTTTTKEKRSPSVLPTTIERKGRYGYAIPFADGATIIYTLLSLARAAGGSEVLLQGEQ